MNIIHCYEDKRRFFGKVSLCRFFCCAIDESTDISSVAQFVQDEGAIDKEFLCMLPLEGTTTVKDIYETLIAIFDCK
jgi:hypothetical protein